MSPGVGVAVDQDRCGAGPCHRLRGRDERVGRQDALVTTADAGRAQRQFQRVRAAADADAVPHAQIVGVLPLERGHLRATDKRGACQHLRPARRDLIGHLAVLGGQVDKGDVVHRHSHRWIPRR